MPLPRLSVLLVLLASVTVPCLVAADPPPRPEHVPAELWEELGRIDQQVAEVQTLRARFTQHRRTPLLKEPMTSEGEVFVKAANVRWETQLPHPATTLVRDDEVHIYQPEDRRLEIYPLDERASLFGGGPLPQIRAMVRRFTLKAAPPDELFDDLPGADAADWLALRLTPALEEEPIAEEVEVIEMLVERATGRLVRFRIHSGAGQWTEYRFFEIEVDVELPGDTFTLTLPDDVEVVRPLEGHEE